MSNIYHTEPATHGKVLLHTSFGDIDIELWGKECPKASRNFIQHAMEGVSSPLPPYRGRASMIVPGSCRSARRARPFSAVAVVFPAHRCVA